MYRTMEKFKLLSGDEIVAKGATKIEVTLPEIGLKDVTPDGSWLEQKQIQSALEARKHLVEAERIEKSGVLSHAEWRDELKLAEVTQQCGGHWHFLGHHRDRKLYIRPEEALYLMEVNCLLLKYCGVKVSLQQAYSLLLSDDISIIQYKVYASLSRVGYKVFRHVYKPEDKKTSEIGQSGEETKINETGLKENTANNLAVECNKLEENETNSMEVENKEESEEQNNEQSTKETESNEMEIDSQTVEESDKDKQSNEIDNNDEGKLSGNSPEAIKNNQNSLSMDVDNTSVNTNDSFDIKLSNTCLPNLRQDPDISTCDNKNISDSCSPNHRNNNANMDPLRRYCQWKLQKLKSRQDKSCKTTDIHKYFENCPDLLESQIVTVKVPKEEYIPKNIFLNNLCYVLNVDNITKKNNTPVSSDSAYSLPDEVNGAHIRRVTDSFAYNRPNPQPQPNSLPHFFQNFRPNIPFRHFGYFRPRTNTHYFQFNLFYQRPFTGNFNPRFQFYPRMHMPMFPGYTNNMTNSLGSDDNANTQSNSQRRRKTSPKTLHFEAIKNLAVRLRQLCLAGNMRPDNIQALQRIINTYNERYRARLRLTEDYEIVNDETIVDTIDLDDDDDESKAKKPRLANKSDLVNENLIKIRQIAYKLKTLEAQNKTSARHRRALSSLIKTFNKSFNADIYMNDNFEVLDRRLINLDSDSDSDCVVEVSPIVPGKKLRNPFNILKRLSEKQVGSATTSRQESAASPSQPDLSSYNFHEVLEKSFKKPWLPDKDDFGRPEVIPRDTMNARIIETKKEEYLFDFYKNQSFNNWVDIKIAFLENIEDTNAILHTEAMMDNNIDLRSLVRPEDCTDMSSVLKKLRIIKSNKDINEESTLAIDFDVYNRDVPNFRKTDRPKPHFRIVCIDETSAYPSGIDIATLHSKYDDDVSILFAVVGIGSISYLQMNPIDLPVYVPCSDLGYSVSMRYLSETDRRLQTTTADRRTDIHSVANR